MRKTFDVFESMLAVAAASMLGAFTLVIMYQVAARYVPIIPRALWTEEISRFTFIWMLFLGAAAATRSQSHFVIDLFADRIGTTWSDRIEMLVQLITAGIGLYMVVGGVHFVEIGFDRISTTSGLPLAWIYLAVPASGLAVCLFSLEILAGQIARYCHKYLEKEPKSADKKGRKN